MVPISDLFNWRILQFFRLLDRGVGGKPKIVAKRHPSVTNSAWESIFQMNVDFHFTTWKLDFLNISEYLAKYSVQMDTSVTPVAGSIFRSLCQTHISKSEFKNEILRSALLDIQVTLLCVCEVDSFIPKLEHLRKSFSRFVFKKEAFEIRFMDSDSWNEAEVNFFRRGKLCRRDYLDYLKNEARFKI